MATAIIARRRMKYVTGTHSHVGWVQLLDGTVLTQEKVLDYMRKGSEFRTRAPNGQEARVAPYRCRTCLETFLRTDSVPPKADNLDALPLF